MTLKYVFYPLFLISFALQAQVDKIDSIEKKALLMPEDTNRVNVMLELTELLWRSAKDSLASVQATGAYNLAVKLHYKEGIGFSLIQQSILRYRKADYQEDLRLLTEATALFKELKNKKGLALAYNGYGNLYYAQSQLEKALDNYLKSLKLREETGDKQGIAYSLYNIGNIYKDQNQSEKALEYHFKSLKMKEELNDKRGIAFSYNNIATIYSGIQQYSTSLTYYLKAIQLFDELGNSMGEAYALGNIGEVYQKQKQYERSLKYLLQAEELFAKAGDKKALAEADNNLANAHLNLHHYEEADHYLALAKDLSMKSNINDQLIENYLLKAKLDSARGNMSGAFDSYKKYNSLKEGVFTLQKSKQIAQIQAAFEAETKDREITVLNQEKALQESEDKNRQIIFISVVAFLVVIAAGLIYFLNLNHRAKVTLAKEKERSEELNKLKDRLLSILSHDLRSPFNSLRGLLSLAQNNHLTEQELKSLLASIQKNTAYVTEFLENLLSWAKSNLKNEKVSPQQFVLEDVISNNFQLLREQAVAKEISLTNKVKDLPLLWADKNMTDIVVRNLLSNAIKFTPNGGEISIAGKQEGNMVIISIRDNGVGIAEEQKTRLFGNTNYSTPGTLNEKGTGLGLVLCREFIEENGGKIWVESTAGQGSTFFFTIPVADR